MTNDTYPGDDWFYGGTAEACPQCEAPLDRRATDCAECGWEPVTETDEHVCDRQCGDDGREHGHPADAKRERDDDDDRWLWHRMQSEFSAWGTK